MRISSPQVLMIEAYLDGELAGDEVIQMQDMMDTHPELQQLYDILKSQKEAIKWAFTSDKKIH